MPSDRGGGSLACAVTTKPGGRICGLLRVGNHATTVVVRSEKLDTTPTVQTFRCSANGCEIARTVSPTAGNPRSYSVVMSNREGKLSKIDLNVERQSENRLVISVNGTLGPLATGSSKTPHVLRYFGDRQLVTLDTSESVPQSLMRGGGKTRIGRSMGYGMFAADDIASGEIVEEAPTISQDTPFLTDYSFGHQGRHILPLGNIALYNHSENPTCLHTLDSKGEVMTLTAIRPIAAGEEMSINYGSHYFAARGLQVKPTTAPVHL